ncbi:MAG: phage antirepressor KilAC domain-containing protein [Fibrobacter sp.]|mgnify:CR=1 FL=1|nr:phage antirepressor KilAC domain-containing protein [Fibrobacter sp.]
MNTQIFNYNNSPITFQRGEDVMVNATEMAKPFGKNVAHWLRNQSTKEFINELGALRNRKGSDLVIVENGVGAWMHEDVAIEFARWLSPAFAIWCNDRIKELLTQGVTTTSDDDAAILHAISLLNKRIETKQQQLAQAQQTITQQENTITQQNEQIQTLQKDADYLNTILQSRKTVTITQIAQDYGMTAKALNNKLHEMRIQRKVNNQWILYSPFIEKGYVQSEAVQITRSNGQPDVVLNTRWSQRGRLFLYEELKKQNILPLIER